LLSIPRIGFDALVKKRNESYISYHTFLHQYAISLLYLALETYQKLLLNDKATKKRKKREEIIKKIYRKIIFVYMYIRK